ncbi:MAG: hypothetical protein WBF48_06300 [Halarcobacter sp.]
MAKHYKIQKKKTLLRTVVDIIFKIFVLITILFFSYILYDKADFKTNEFDFDRKKGNSRNQGDAPSKLKWFDDFKGVENVSDKKKKEKSSSTGFSYKGF